VQLVKKECELTDFGKTDAPIGKLTILLYLISHISNYGSWWDMNQIDVVTTFQNIEIDDDNIYMTPPGG